MTPRAISAERLKEARLSTPGRGNRHLARQSLAAAVGVTDATIWRWEPDGFPYADQLVALAEELDVSIDGLFGRGPLRPGVAREVGPDGR